MRRSDFLAVLLAMLCCGCNLIGGGGQIDPVNPDPPKPEPVDPKPDDGAKVFPESDYWNSLANQVESGVISNTHTLILTANRLEKLGRLKDLSRLDQWKKRIDITDANKSEIAKSLRG